MYNHVLTNTPALIYITGLTGHGTLFSNPIKSYRALEKIASPANLTSLIVSQGTADRQKNRQMIERGIDR